MFFRFSRRRLESVCVCVCVCVAPFLQTTYVLLISPSFQFRLRSLSLIFLIYFFVRFDLLVFMMFYFIVRSADPLPRPGRSSLAERRDEPVGGVSADVYSWLLLRLLLLVFGLRSSMG